MTPVLSEPPTESPASENSAFGVNGIVQKSQEIVEQSILRNPMLCVGAAVAAGAVLGWLVKRN